MVTDDFIFEIQTLSHYDNNHEHLGFLNEIEHLALVNHIIFNKLENFYFYTETRETIVINPDGTYKSFFEGYTDIKNLLSDNISLKKGITENLSLLYTTIEYYDVNKQFEIAFDINFHRGDVVKIVDTGYHYTGYTLAFSALNMLPKPKTFFLNGDNNKNNTYIITKITKHRELTGKRLIVLHSNEHNFDILIEKDGIQKVTN